jgi:hypothetical protein
LFSRNDGYVPRDGFTPLDHIWPGCDVRFVDCGHISGYVLHQSLFKKTIAEAVDRYRRKYFLDGTLREDNHANEKVPLVSNNKLVEAMGIQNSQMPNQSGDSSAGL